MPDAQIEETCDDASPCRYEMCWREEGTLYGCRITRRMVKKLGGLRLIVVDHVSRTPSVSIYTLKKP